MFENIDVALAKRALNDCLNQLNDKKSIRVMNGIKNNKIWNTPARDTLYDALNKLFNEKYKNIREKINKYLIVMSKIEEYKNNETLKNSKNYEINDYQEKIDIEYSNLEVYEQNPEDYEEEIRQAKENINTYTNYINSLKDEVSDCDNIMSGLKNEIDTMI